MIKLTTGTAKVSKAVNAKLVNKGVLEGDRKYKMVQITDAAVHSKVQSLVSDALSDLSSQIAAFAESNGADGTRILQAMENNIKAFNLTAGSGYSDEHKAYLIANGTDSGVEITAEDFENESGPVAVKADETVGSLEF